MGGVRQQFSTAAEVALVRASVPLFRELGAPLFEPVGYLFLATSDEGATAGRAAELQRGLGVPVEDVDPAPGPRPPHGRRLGAVICREDGVADPEASTRELVRRAAERGVEVREGVDARDVDADVLVVACGAVIAGARARGVELPMRPLCRQLVDVGPVEDLPADLPMAIEEETGFHFRRAARTGCGSRCRSPCRAGARDEVGRRRDRRGQARRLAHRYPAGAEAPIVRAWAGLYDMTPDAHPVIGWVGEGVYAACGFSGHGFMQSPAVGRAVAEELLGLAPTFDLTPYRLERFAGDATFPETLVL